MMARGRALLVASIAVAGEAAIADGAFQREGFRRGCSCWRCLANEATRGLHWRRLLWIDARLSLNFVAQVVGVERGLTGFFAHLALQ